VEQLCNLIIGIDRDRSSASLDFRVDGTETLRAEKRIHFHLDKKRSEAAAAIHLEAIYSLGQRRTTTQAMSYACLYAKSAFETLNSSSLPRSHFDSMREKIASTEPAEIRNKEQVE
jgi:capsid protein